MTNLSDVLAYLEEHADAHILIKLQGEEIPRILRQRGVAAIQVGASIESQVSTLSNERLKSDTSNDNRAYTMAET